MTSPTSYIVTGLTAISLVACKPSPRYTMHQGTDPRTGQPLTMRLNTETGEVMELGKFDSVNGPWAVWSFSMDLQQAAKLNDQIYQDRKKTKTNSEDLIIK